ncbi:MAG: hypothetical protein ABGY42_18465 [bacterium]
MIGKTLLVAVAVLLAGAEAQAQSFRMGVTFRWDPASINAGASATFRLPRFIRIGRSVYIIPDINLVGEHTCTVDVALTGDDRGIDAMLFLARGARKAGVFRGQVTSGVGASLFLGGCDGDVATPDAFQGSLLAAGYAEPFFWAAQLMNATTHSETPVIEEIRSYFSIDAARPDPVFRITALEGINLGNRGGSATGVGSAYGKMTFGR